MVFGQQLDQFSVAEADYHSIDGGLCVENPSTDITEPVNFMHQEKTGDNVNDEEESSETDFN